MAKLSFTILKVPIYASYPSKGNKRDILHDGNDVCMYYVHLIHKHYTDSITIDYVITRHHTPDCFHIPEVTLMSGPQVTSGVSCVCVVWCAISYPCTRTTSALRV